MVCKNRGIRSTCFVGSIVAGPDCHQLLTRTLLQNIPHTFQVSCPQQWFAALKGATINTVSPTKVWYTSVAPGILVVASSARKKSYLKKELTCIREKAYAWYHQTRSIVVCAYAAVVYRYSWCVKVIRNIGSVCWYFVFCIFYNIREKRIPKHGWMYF